MPHQQRQSSKLQHRDAGLLISIFTHIKLLPEDQNPILAINALDVDM